MSMEYKIKCQGCGKTEGFSNEFFGLEKIQITLHDEGWVWMPYEDEHYCPECLDKAFESFVDYAKKTFYNLPHDKKQAFLFDLLYMNDNTCMKDTYKEEKSND